MKLNGSLGISITGGKNAVSSHPDLGIFVKKLVSGGSAEKDGRLQPGDQILSVDGKSLQGLAQDR
jgi:afadin